MKVAISTTDGIEITKDHFGDGKFFLIYEIGDRIKFIEKRENNSPEEEHGAKEKAKGISAILSDIPVFIGYQFGPNIMRIKDKFLPVISRERKIEKALELLRKYENEIKKELKAPRGRAIIMNEGGIRFVEVKDTKDF
ncbi:Dinitrogenase iron-molybdenum cofactor domain protein [Aciduliprofundum boonei T469]|nr:Dinitrogenase iron-molybdenum cofactor domain protein [Aciduliprofundum boonei T469]